VLERTAGGRSSQSKYLKWTRGRADGENRLLRPLGEAYRRRRTRLVTMLHVKQRSTGTNEPFAALRSWRGCSAESDGPTQQRRRQPAPGSSPGQSTSTRQMLHVKPEGNRRRLRTCARRRRPPWQSEEQFLETRTIPRCSDAQSGVASQLMTCLEPIISAGHEGTRARGRNSDKCQMIGRQAEPTTLSDIDSNEVPAGPNGARQGLRGSPSDPGTGPK
jgi:hypothetical protein